MKIGRDQLSTILSLILLSISMVVWVDLFIFSKVVYLPSWAEMLPVPMMAMSILVFICLIPAAFFTKTLQSACWAVMLTILISPFSALVAYALNPLYQGKYLLGNIVFNYFFIVSVGCFVPAFFSIGFRAVIYVYINIKRS